MWVDERIERAACSVAFVSVDVAMMTEVLPTFDEAGKDLGVVSMSYQIPLLAIGGGENSSALFVAAIEGVR